LQRFGFHRRQIFALALNDIRARFLGD